MPCDVHLRGAPHACRAAAAVAILASVPYAAIKVAWLAGSSVGSTSLEAATELHDRRHTFELDSRIAHPLFESAWASSQNPRKSSLVFLTRRSSQERDLRACQMDGNEARIVCC